MRFDRTRLASVIMLASMPNVFTAHADFPANSAKALIAYAKAKTQNTAVEGISSMADRKQKLALQGAEVVRKSLAGKATFIRVERASWKRVIDKANVTLV